MPILKHRIFLIFLISFIFGIFLASFFKISYFLCYSFFLFCLPFLILFWENKRIRIVFLSFIFLLLGIIRYNLSWPKITPEKIQFYNNRKVVFEGIVKRVDERLDKKELVVKANKIFINEESIKIKGNVLVYLPLYSSYFYGDRLKISCHLLSPKPIEKFAYHEYLARYNIYSVCFPKEVEILARKQGNFFINQIFKIREKIKLAIDQNFTEPEGSIFSALLLGIKKEIPQRVREVFSKTGTAHILAVSGLHVMIMTKILIFILINLSLKRQDAFWIVSLFLIFYILLTGASPSAIRAGIMGFLLILAEKIGRKKESLNLIFFSAALMLLFNPKLLKNDIGFQLSYLGILGINYLENFFYRVFKSIFKKKTNLSQLLATTFSAQVFVFPLVLYYWGYLSLIAPIANFLVLNVLPYLMTLGFLFAFCSFIFLPLSKILFFPIWLILYFLFRILKFLSDLPVFSINFGQINFVMVVILYLAIIYFTFKAKTIK